MKKILLLAALFCSLFQLSNAQRVGITSLNVPSSNYVYVAAHRGDWIYVPENSIPALTNAIQMGVEIMETDVRLTKDDQLVIMHDETLDRTTNGSGKVSDFTLLEIKKLRMKNAIGSLLDYTVPSLEDYIKLAKGKIHLYLDKAGYDLPQHPKGYKIQKILEMLEAHNLLEETIFVLDFPYTVAKEIFGDRLEKVIYCPVIDDGIPDLEVYVDEYITKLNPSAFQFRFAQLDSKSYKLLPKVLKSGSKAFVAATWKLHTAGHDDLVSIFEDPSRGWGWLIEQGFSVLETNYPKDLIRFLEKNPHCRANDSKMIR